MIANSSTCNPILFLEAGGSDLLLSLREGDEKMEQSTSGFTGWFAIDKFQSSCRTWFAPPRFSIYSVSPLHNKLTHNITPHRTANYDITDMAKLHLKPIQKAEYMPHLGAREISSFHWAQSLPNYNVGFDGDFESYSTIKGLPNEISALRLLQTLACIVARLMSHHGLEVNHFAEISPSHRGEDGRELLGGNEFYMDHGNRLIWAKAHRHSSRSALALNFVLTKTHRTSIP
jgi:hypothetical protein